jgi:hypothetical protein
MKVTCLVVGLTLLWTPLTGAECAWILWTSSMTVPDIWTVLNSFSSQAACEQGLADMLERSKANPRNTVKGRTIITKQKAASGKGHDTTTVGFYCVPDTIDPRAPKVK